MRNLISLGAPQNGVEDFPRCEEVFKENCEKFRSSIKSFAYSWPSQRFIAPATYWHDRNETKYKRGSTFLAVINNEKDYNENYVINLQKLRRLVLVKYENDGALVPKSTAWFGYYDSNGKEYPMQSTEMYRKNKLGLQSLKEQGKLIFLLSPGEHISLHRIWFAQNIIPYLKEK
jgi:palmitoyl-protein thioesterase